MQHINNVTSITLTTDGTIPTRDVLTVRVTITTDVTGIILEGGFPLQMVTVINESDHTIIFAEPAASHVADALIISRVSARQFTWIDEQWYAQWPMDEEYEE